jgi:segregation and condensation protein B
MEETESNGGNDLAPVAAEQLLIEALGAPAPAETVDTELKAVLEALVYVTDEPLSSEQIASALGQPKDLVERLLAELLAEYDKPEHGVTIRQIAGGYQMGTKPEHHDAVRNFVKNLKPPMRLSMAALETLAVVAYKQPITAPEIMEIRGVQGAGVLKTLLDRRLVAAAGRKNVIGRPILYRTTKDFLVQFGLKDLGELPTLKEFEEIRRLAISDDVAVATEEQPPEEQPRQDVAEEVLSPPAEE